MWITLLGGAIFIVLIGVSIGLHEYGHYRTARAFGVKVTEFMVGFGPTLFSWTRGETRFGLKAIPLGGYCRIVGMYPPNPDGSVPVSSTGRITTLIEQARKEASAEIGPGDEDRVFYKISTPKKITVMIAGPVMNLLLAFVLFGVVLSGIGVNVPSTTLAAVVPCTPTLEHPTGDKVDGSCPAGSEPTSALVAGLQPGDEIVTVAGRPVSTWDDVTAAITATAPGHSLVLSVLRDGQSREMSLTPALITEEVYDERGRPTGETSERTFVGVRAGLDRTREPVTAIPGEIWEITTASAKALAAFPARMVELTGTLVTDAERPLDSPVSVVGVTRLSAEVGNLTDDWANRMNMWLLLAAQVNLFLFLFNLVPLLPLDGGHIVGALYGAWRKRWAKWRGRPDPGFFDTAKLLPVAYAVAVVLLGIGVITIVADVIKPLTFGG